MWRKYLKQNKSLIGAFLLGFIIATILAIYTHLFSLIFSALDSIVTSHATPTLLQNSAIGFITLFIPIIVLIFQNKFKGVSDDYLSNQIRLDLLMYEFFIPAVFFLLTGPLFFDGIDYQFKKVFFIIWVGLLLFCMWRLHLLVKEISSPSYSALVWDQYIEKIHLLKNSEDVVQFWDKILLQKYGRFDSDEKIFISFAKSVDKEMGSASATTTLSDLIGVFNKNISSREISFLLYSDHFLSKILELDFIIWQKLFTLYKNNSQNFELKRNYQKANHQISILIDQITTLAFSKDSPGSFEFLRQLEKHAEKYQNDSIENPNADVPYQYYPPPHPKIPQFLELISSSKEAHDIWVHYFPTTWKVTKENLLNKNNKMVTYFQKGYLQLAEDRIRRSDAGGYDSVLSDIHQGLFPSTDPITWARIVMIMMHWDYGDVDWVLKPTLFGLSGRIFIGDTSDDEGKAFANYTKLFEDNSFELALIVFPILTNPTFYDTLLPKFVALQNQIDITDADARKVEAYVYILKRLRQEVTESTDT